MSIRVFDLKDQTGTPYPRAILYCAICGDTSSANRGDYSAAPPDHVFTCCDEPMKLGRMVTQFVEEVQP